MAKAGRITIVPTPIGNLGDITLRALDALRTADVVCAEDTRVSGGLLAALGISKRLERLDENAMGSRAADVVARAADGQHIAYCTDAGMPGVSDPGMRLVAAAREAGVAVEVLPGASAAITAYVASGTACSRFYFGGFFPRKAGERERMLDSLRSLDAALVFYESPNRLCDALDTIARAYPMRQVAVCRELTKLHEEVARGTASQRQGRDRVGHRRARCGRAGAGCAGSAGDGAGCSCGGGQREGCAPHAARAGRPFPQRCLRAGAGGDRWLARAQLSCCT